MRILYHHRTLADGAEGVHIGAMVDAFRSLGHDVRLIGAAPATSRTAPDGGLSQLRQWLPSLAVELAAIGANAFDYLLVRREIARFRPDVIYKRHGRFDVAVAAAAARAGVPTILEVNCLFSQPPYSQFEPLWFLGLARRMERYAVRAASVAFAVSSPLARTATSLGGRPVQVVPNGADLTIFDPDRADAGDVRARHRLDGAFVIGWVGVLREWHGLEVLLEAVRSVPNAHLLIVGDGPGRPVLEAAASAAGIRDRVTVTGRVAHADMPHYISAMDVAVVADERTGVASPMKLLEYMAMRRAVVAPATDNIRDLVTDRVNGLLFRIGSAAELAERLRELAADATLRERLGTAARTSIQQGRTWSRIASDVLSFSLRQP